MKKHTRTLLIPARQRSADDWKFYDGLRGHWLQQEDGTWHYYEKTGIRLPLPGKIRQ